MTIEEWMRNVGAAPLSPASELCPSAFADRATDPDAFGATEPPRDEPPASVVAPPEPSGGHAPPVREERPDDEIRF